MVGKYFAILISVFALLVAQTSLSSAEVSGTVELGLAQLADTIVKKSSAADLTRIAVLPFPNADGTCSVLSTYVVDELILSLFSVPNSKLEIVERSQLESLLAEMKIGESGLLNPETTKKLGNLSGVGALTMGTITVIGDTVRLNARLVATDTGRTISAAAVTIPKTQALDDLLNKPVTGGLSCGARATNGQNQQDASGSSLQLGHNDFKSSDFEASLQRASLETQDGKVYLTVVAIVKNVNKNKFKFHLLGKDTQFQSSNGLYCTPRNQTRSWSVYMDGNDYYSENAASELLNGDTTMISGLLECGKTAFDEKSQSILRISIVRQGQDGQFTTSLKFDNPKIEKPSN